MNAGACLCGALRYEVEGPFNNLMHCHCSMCRKHHGAPFATFVGASSKGFRWISGEGAAVEYPSSASGRRRFCGVCGLVCLNASGDPKAPKAVQTPPSCPAPEAGNPVDLYSGQEMAGMSGLSCGGRTPTCSAGAKGPDSAPR